LRVNGEKVDEIVQALKRLLCNPEEAAEMGGKARLRVLDNFTHVRRVDQLRELVLLER
jgi:spore maturation protein CgeB